jgi:ATP-dependent Clp protease ATP-binding subunit ClpA
MDCDRVGTEHLLLGLLVDEAGGAARLLREAGTTLSAARHKVREASSPAPLRDHSRQPPLPTTPRADLALGRAVRLSNHQRANAVTSEHLLWGVVDVEGTAGQVLRGLGVDIDRLRTALENPHSPDVGAPDVGESAIHSPLPCPSCGVDLDGNIACRAVATVGEGGPRRALVFRCTACGHVLSASPA